MEAIKLSSLTYDILKDIVGIYDKIVKGHGLRYLYKGDLKMVIEGIQDSGAIEWRFGSKLTHHSKLWIKRKAFSKRNDPLIYFCFDANLDLKNEGHLEPESKILETEFNEAVNNYLTAIKIR